MTDRDILGIVSDELFTIMPILSRSIDKKLVKKALHNSKLGITPLHFEIMNLLGKTGTLHTAEISKRLNLARCQMTGLIDKLINMKFVKKQTNEKDRRQTDIVLTSRGDKVIKDDSIKIKNAIEKSLSGLTTEELEEISVSMRKLRDIFAKLD